MCFKGTLGALGDKAVKEWGLALGKELFDLGRLELFLKYGLTEAETFGCIVGLELRHVVGLLGFVKLGLGAVGQGESFDDLLVLELFNRDGLIAVEDKLGLPFANLTGLGNRRSKFKCRAEWLIETGDETIDFG